MVAQAFLSLIGAKMTRDEYKQFIIDAQKRSKEFVQDAKETLAYNQKQVEWWNERVKEAESHLAIMEAAYQERLTWKVEDTFKGNEEPEKARPRWKNIVVVNEVKQ